MRRVFSKSNKRRPEEREAPGDDDSGIKLIVAYKLTKAVAEVLLAVALFFLAARASDDLRQFARAVRHHVTAAWCAEILDRVVAATNRQHVRIVALASFADGIVSFVEGWSLHRRFWWSHWLIVCATASLLPFELVALTRHWSFPRAAVLVLNVAIVFYLVQNRVNRRQKEPSAPSAEPPDGFFARGQR